MSAEDRSSSAEQSADAHSTEEVFRNAVRQLLSATRHLLDAVEEVIEDDERVGKMTDAVERGFAAAGVDLRRLRDAFTGNDEPSRTHDPRSSENGAAGDSGRIRRIDVE